MTKQSTTKEEIISFTKEAIIKEAKRIEENSLYSAKGHFVAAQFWTNFHLWIGVPTVILAALAGTSALAQFDNHNIIAGILSLIVVVLAAITTFLNQGKRASIHLAYQVIIMIHSKAELACFGRLIAGEKIQSIYSRIN